MGWVEILSFIIVRRIVYMDTHGKLNVVYSKVSLVEEYERVDVIASIIPVDHCKILHKRVFVTLTKADPHRPPPFLLSQS